MTERAGSRFAPQIVAIDDGLIREVHYLNAASRGSTEVECLPVVRGTLAAPLTGELDALIACSDLQGIVPGPGGRSELLGVQVAAVLGQLADDGVIPAAARTGVLLAGDLYSVAAANRRGGYGDVADVWVAFAERFAWVAGVAGNHDDVSGVAGLGERVHLLDGHFAELDGLRIGGVGGIMGNPRKPGRRSEADQLRAIDRTLDHGVDILVLHEGPRGGDRQPGNAAIRATIEAAAVGLTVCGHDHWRVPLADHACGQILNVDARVVVLIAPARDEQDAGTPVRPTS
ncbi:MAG TPA: metallophosphoesterase [Kofleriaceae bacterium]|nr:metallophosphoesterase [Kofleriaceae bacterium]